MANEIIYCGISNIVIPYQKECLFLPIFKIDTTGYLPATLPIKGICNDQLSMSNIIHDDNVTLIENYFGITIEEFIELLIFNKWTDNAKDIRKKIKNSYKLDLISKWTYMWIDKKSYDVMSVCYDGSKKGYHALGTPEMLNLLGFKEVLDNNISNYDPKRFTKKYQKDNVDFYSDGKTLLSNTGRYIFRIDENKENENSLSFYVDIPNNLLYLKDKTSEEVWKLKSNRHKENSLRWILGRESIGENMWDEQLQDFKYVKSISELYIQDIELYGDDLAKLINIYHNLWEIGGEFKPFNESIAYNFKDANYEIQKIILQEFIKITSNYNYFKNEQK